MKIACNNLTNDESFELILSLEATKLDNKVKLEALNGKLLLHNALSGPNWSHWRTTPELSSFASFSNDFFRREIDNARRKRGRETLHAHRLS